MSETKSNKIEHGFGSLSSNQIHAMSMMLMGSIDMEIAEKIGVSRPTVTQWRNKDPHFRAIFNELKKNRLFSCQEGLMDLLTDSVKLLREEIREGNWRVALAMFKIVSPWQLKELDLPTDVNEIAIEVVQEETRLALGQEEALMDPTLAEILHDDNHAKLMREKHEEYAEEYGL